MSGQQSIFDNEIFFQGYKALRDSGVNYNELLEQPAMERLLPDVRGKSVLDLGCGYGRNCLEFARRGAAPVTGIDLSEKMLAVAGEESCHERIEYFHMNMTEIGKLGRKFDLIYSSLAFHYVENFSGFAETLYSCLEDGGVLLFSQEHPLVTATFEGRQHHNRDEAGNVVSFTFSDYGQPGKRSTFWYVDGVEKYHRRFSDIVNALAGAGFVIKAVEEPLPEEAALQKLPALAKERIKPTFLLVKAEKPAGRRNNGKTDAERRNP